jgi:hypothetical protein
MRTGVVNSNTCNLWEPDLDIGGRHTFVGEKFNALEQMATVWLRKEVH